jgi:hypothetical protein
MSMMSSDGSLKQLKRLNLVVIVLHSLFRGWFSKSVGVGRDVAIFEQLF